MKQLLAAAFFTTAIFSASASLAEDKELKLSVPGMNCASCPFMVKSALLKVNGVKSAFAEMEDRSATIVYDDTVADVETIKQATADIGYPSTVITLN